MVLHTLNVSLFSGKVINERFYTILEKAKLKGETQ